MPGRGPVPKADARTRHAPQRGGFQAAEAECWVGDVPEAPDGLMPASVEAWGVWFGSWFSAFWLPADLPALRQLIRLYDQVERGEFQRAGELRLQMDTYGITPKGQQDRRWSPPAEADGVSATTGARYAHLRAI